MGTSRSIIAAARRTASRFSTARRGLGTRSSVGRRRRRCRPGDPRSSQTRTPGTRIVVRPRVLATIPVRPASRIRFSRRSRRSSYRSSLLRPSRRPSSMSIWRLRLRSDCGETPSSRASSGTDLPAALAQARPPHGGTPMDTPQAWTLILPAGPDGPVSKCPRRRGNSKGPVEPCARLASLALPRYATAPKGGSAPNVRQTWLRASRKATLCPPAVAVPWQANWGAPPGTGCSA